MFLKFVSDYSIMHMYVYVCTSYVHMFNGICIYKLVMLNVRGTRYLQLYKQMGY